MRKENKKRKWVTPCLISLVKGKLGEVVLTDCKGAMAGTPNNDTFNCYRNDFGCGNCSGGGGS